MSTHPSPAPKQRSAVGSPYKSRAKAVDLVTGKTKVEYFFDPSQILDDADSSGATPFKSPSKRNISADASNPMIYSSKHLYVPCTFIKSLSEENDGGENLKTESGPALVKTSDGTLYKVRDLKELSTLTAPDDYVGVNDVLHLANISEASLLHTLRIRYKRDDIYTNAGPILISINPYKPIVRNGESLYSQESMMAYRQSDSFTDPLDPHLFQVADRAYSALLESVHSVPHVEDDDPSVVLDGDIGVAPGQARNQSIIISGESGAGKTEATKFIMQYLARITKRKANASSEANGTSGGKTMAPLEDRVLSSNPLLETFGNAQTLRNDNSSRFGKFIHINFSTETGAIVGARISNYLLEQTRVTTQIEGERNYHIFYQLFAGANPETLHGLGLESGPESFKYLGCRSSPKTKRDARDFEETKRCLSRIGVSLEEQQSVFGLVAAVLHLGNVAFEESDTEDHSAVVTEESQPSLQRACTLLGLDEADVTEAILTKVLTIGGKTITKPSTIAMAEDKRDALAKMTYSSLFLWLVEAINNTLDHPEKENDRFDRSLGFIGVLDIYGFETFDVNGYEQLLINYCNEKLQRHFNRHLFEVEQSLYSTEGVDWTYITFNDNRPCLELIEGGSGKGGILSTLDDSYAGMGDAGEKDVKFVGQLHKLFGSVAGDKNSGAGHEHFITPKFGSDRQFSIIHYAGEVRYTVDGFVEKNEESLSNELKQLGDLSTLELSKAVYAHVPSRGDASQPSGARSRSSIRGFSVAAQFKMSLQSLVEDLELTQPHYIRCIKPNLKKAPSSFAAGEVLKQLRYSGMMEAIRIRREGYALRETHQSFYSRFVVLLDPSEVQENEGIEQLVEKLSKTLNVTDADWQIGHSKIFVRRELSDKLERLAKLRVHAAARALGRFGRKVSAYRLSSFLATWARFRLVMLKKYRINRASTKIQTACRRYARQKTYKATIGAVIKIQSLQRKRQAVQRVRKIRDPYCDMTYKDLKELLKSEKQEMAKAVDSQDFRRAAEIETNMESISAIMEERKPMTRKRLEEKISNVEKDLQAALQAKSYAAAGPLQDDLEALVQQRVLFPTEEELREDIKRAQLAVAEAAKNRDFAAAAASQSELDKARSRLEATLERENESDDEAGENQSDKGSHPGGSIEGFESRSELETNIAALHSQLEEAVSSKDFKKASELQDKIDDHEKLRLFFPSLEELEAQLSEAKKSLDEAIARKDFSRAGNMNEVIGKLEQQIKSEKERGVNGTSGKTGLSSVSVKSLDGQVITFDSRFALEQEIIRTKTLQSEAVAARQFRRAEDSQSIIEKMEKLRDALPTIQEMNQVIRTKKVELQKAIAEKRFGDAESLDGEINHLEEKVELEKSKGPQSQSNESTPNSKLPKTVPVTSAHSDRPKRKGTAIPKSIPTQFADTPSRARSGVVRMNSSGMSVQSAPVVHQEVGQSMPAAATVVGDFSPPPMSHNPPVSVCHLPDDVSDVTSLHSFPSWAPSKTERRRSSRRKLPSHQEDPTVVRLRPKKPLVSSLDDTVLDVCIALTTKRGDAALLVHEEGGLAGIITDTDVTRRVVAKHLDPGTTSVAKVMTPNPMYVTNTESAIDAMLTMVENRFRHLPVVDDRGGIVGLLDITKCLNDAISKLERSQPKQGNSPAEELLQAVKSEGVGGAQTAALQAILGPLLAQVSGSQPSRTIDSLLDDAPTTIVYPGTSVLDAAMLMAERRKAALVVDNGVLVGIFAFKDMMTRVVAKQLPLELTDVSQVMTPHPDTVSPEVTVLEALQTMHDHRFLTLPVCSDDGSVVGLVDVMDLIHGCGGPEEWRSLFHATFDLEDVSETGSYKSVRSPEGAPSIAGSKRSNQTKEKNTSLVSKLRPKKALSSSMNASVQEVSQMLSSKRGDAALIVNEDGGLAGIFTNRDVTCRVVAKHLDASSTSVHKVLTASPTCVSMTGLAIDALSTMVENRFRHLPVVDENGGVVGLLDIARCLNDAISKIEKLQAKQGKAAGALLQAVQDQGGEASGLETMLAPLLAQAFGSTESPTLRSLLEGEPATVVDPGTSVLDVGMLMAERRKAAVVVENERLVGIFGFKDMMTRVVAKELPLELTTVSAVMTQHPESVSPEMTVLEALQTMHDNKFLTLPVCEEDGTVFGLVDVMDLIHGCGGVNGWQTVFSNTLDLEDVSDTASAFSARASTVVMSSRQRSSRSVTDGKPRDIRPVSKLRPKKPLTSSADDSILAVTQMLTSKRGDAALLVGEDGGLYGIITDTDITRRVVAKYVDPGSTAVSHVMTANPTFVSMTDPAMEAMTTMVENRFRHLPVVDDNGGVVGLLDIARCLHDALSKLEKAQAKGGAAGEALLQAVQGQGGQSAALQSMLAPLLEQAFGSTESPTLRSLLEGEPGTVVDPATSVLDAGMLMAERRKAAVVVENGLLVGIFGFKDMMTRVVAKELPLELTAVSAVMTQHPEAVSPELTVLEALQMMHDNKFLTLPVCEEDGTVVGLVDVMDLIYGCGGANGWQTVFSNALDVGDVSDTASAYSKRGAAAGSVMGRSTKSGSRSANEAKSPVVQPVSKLRPKKPLTSSVNDSVLAVTRMLSTKRGDAALLVGDQGGLEGILTDQDVTRRVVGKYLDAGTTIVSQVMTPSPTCVSMTDPAMDAMATMVENHFRHLPVVDEGGGVVGLLDIAKCLNDAISRLERAQSKKDTGNAAGNAILQAVQAQGVQGDQAAALQSLLGPLIAQAFGSQPSPTLGSLLEGKPCTVVEPSTSVLDAGLLMTESRKAALVVNGGQLVGIFGFKDMMTRVVAKELEMDLIPVSHVMTPNPEFASPEDTALQALQTMHDNKVLSLPVCDADGTVVGLVDVMDVICGCGGAVGWRSVFSSTLNLEDPSETASLLTDRDSVGRSVARSSGRRSAAKNSTSKSVSRLRPKKPLICVDGESVVSVAKMLANNRGDAAIIVNSSGGLAGIITDKDMTRRVVAKHADPTAVPVSEVMTPNPTFVSTTDSAMDAMMLMVEKHFRHLPVSDDDGAVVGVLDVAKCLNDAISKLEKGREKKQGMAEDLVKAALEQSGHGATALQAVLGPLVSQAFNDQSSRTLRSVLADAPSTVVTPDTSVLEAAMAMTEAHKATLVVDNGELVGIFGFKDLMTRVLAQERNVESTSVEEVMTPSPETVPPETTILEALQTMHDNGFLSLPVCEADGAIVGLVDVMDVIDACGGVDGWRAVMDGALEADDETSAQKSGGKSGENRSRRGLPAASQNRDHGLSAQRDTPKLPGNIPVTLEFEHGKGHDDDEGGMSLNDTFNSDFRVVSFKVIDLSGHTHRLRTEAKVSCLHEAFHEKVKGANKKRLRFKFVDEEGDAIMITSDDDLAEAVRISRAASRGGSPTIKLTAVEIDASGSIDTVAQAGIGAVVAFAGMAAMVAFRPNR